MESLAEGGFQVGALAKCYFPDGVEVKERDIEEAIGHTNDLLSKDRAVIFEAAIRHRDLYIRTDILIKDGRCLDLIEVKSASFDSTKGITCLNKKGEIASGWESYVQDVAFQKYVISRAFPRYQVSAYLMMADKSAICATDGINQKFKISKSPEGKVEVVVSDKLTPEDLQGEILKKLNVDDGCAVVYQSDMGSESEPLSYPEFIEQVAYCYKRDEKIISSVSPACGSCEFTATQEEMEAGLKSGFHECWKEQLGWNEKDFEEPTVMEIWNFKKKGTLFEEGRIKLRDVKEEDINPKKDGKPGMSYSERQWLQVRKALDHDTHLELDRKGLLHEFAKWTFPLHFIDFETSMVAIPFNKGRHPYEGIAFQYSHHVVYQDGRVEHKSQYLNTVPGFFPNYELIRALKKDLEKDNGSIFRYAAHENTFLNHIYAQLQEDKSAIPDKKDLCRFIQSITKSSGMSKELWLGPRNMVDMCELVKRYYYDPATNGSNSIKDVLPAVLNSSSFLQEKYSKPIYGADDGIPSLNYKDWTWIVWENGVVLDPYTLLPKMFQDMTEQENEIFSESDELKSGGAAMTAYARMQFEEMSTYEREEIKKALLKYCELDTMAMVMIYEGWKSWIG